MSADEKATEAQARQALTDFQAKRDQYKQNLAAARKQLAADLKLAERPRLEAALTAMGVLDNGLLSMGGRGRMGQGGAGGTGMPGSGGPGMGPGAMGPGMGPGMPPGGPGGQGGPPPAPGSPKGF